MAEEACATLTLQLTLRLRPLDEGDFEKDFVPLLEQLTVVGSIP